MIPFINDEMIAHQWLTAKQVSDIVAIAEMTPGSLGINCATFVGMQIAGIPGAIIATLGVMSPSLTVCMIVAHFLVKFKDNQLLQNALYGIRPVCIGMILAIIFPLGQTNYLDGNTVLLPVVFIGAIAAVLFLKFKLSIPKVILISAILGLILVR